MDLDSHDPEDRRRGVFAIVRLPDPEGILYLRRIASEDDSIELRYLARKGLNLVSQTGHDVFGVRPEDRQPVRNLGDASLVEIAHNLESSDPRVRFHALDVARRRRDVSLLDYILDMAHAEGHREIRATLVRVIGELGFEEGADVVRSFTRDEDPRVRANALEVMSVHGSGRGAELFWWALGDRDHRVRASCIRALANLEALDLIRYCRPMLDSPSLAERDTGVFCLSQGGDAHALPLLQSCLSEPYASIRNKAYKGLIRLSKAGVQEADGILRAADRTGINIDETDFFELE